MRPHSSYFANGQGGTTESRPHDKGNLFRIKQSFPDIFVKNLSPYERYFGVLTEG